MTNRYQFLNGAEVAEFDNPREIDPEKRSLFFHDVDESMEFKKMETKIGFILLRGYFLANKKFFNPEKFQKEDIKYVCELVSAEIGDLDRDSKSHSWYSESTFRYHKRQILNEEGFRSFDDSIIQAQHEADELVKSAIRPKKMFFSLVKYLIEHKIEVPNYTRISSMVMESFNSYENGIIDQINLVISDGRKQILDAFVTLPTFEGNLSPHNPYLITTLKKPGQDTKMAKVKESVEKFKIVSDLFMEFEDILSDLAISDSLVNYYANWMIIAEQPQFNAIQNPGKKYLYTLSFITYQYRIRQDLFVDIFLKSIQSFLNQVDNKVKEDFLARRATPSKHIDNAKSKIIQSIDKHEVKLRRVEEILRSNAYSSDQKVFESLEVIGSGSNIRDHILKEFENLENSISDRLRDEMYFDKMEIGSSRLSRKLKDLFLELNFNPRASASIIYRPVTDFQSKKGRIPLRPEAEFLTQSQSRYVFREGGLVNTKLYKTLLFVETANHIKSGSLNLKHSNNYRSINDYMIDENKWVDKSDELLIRSNLYHLKDGKSLIAKLKDELHRQYVETNEKLSQNEFIKINNNGRPIVETPKREGAEKSVLSQIIGDRVIPLVDVLFDISQSTGFLNSFSHFSMKRGAKPPSDEVLIAGIISLGCNIGVRKMGKITKGIGAEKLENTVRWFFSQENLNEANRVIIELIDKLSVPKLFKEKVNELHTSSDGQKFGVSVPSIHSSYSYKYFGTGRGVSAYSFVDEYSRMFYDTVISSSEREAAYVLDGLLYNDVIESSIHSTDTHGYTEVIFGICNSLGIEFAPRIKKTGGQVLYTFRENKTKMYLDKGYRIIPDNSHYIDENLLLDQWDNILRLLVSLKTKEVTASVLLKRLSSYAKNHPLYKALKELGRIHKSIFILKYFNDLELRQRIEKQLNKGELWHKFAKEVFFGNNQEFKVGSKEEQHLALTCRNLIQNAVVLWNYLTLTSQLAARDSKSADSIIKTLNNTSMISWSHVNIHGEYDLDLLGIQSANFDISSLINYEALSSTT
jgi:TnpA family transposase